MDLTRCARLAGGVGVLGLTIALLACRTPPVRVADEPVDWQAVADVGVIEIVTSDADGDARVTKVWFVLVDGVPYLRTNRSRWLENLRRDPAVWIRIDHVDHPQLAHEVTSDALLRKVDAASREKYGWQDAVVDALRSSRPQIIRLSPRAPG